MKNFKVSIIIPVYNSEKYISEAVESCIKQKQTGEVILIDDGSKDNTLKILQSLAQKYHNIKILQHEDKGNHGRSASRNLGIINSNYEFISFLDSDDMYADNRFEYEEKIFKENPKVEGVYGITKAIFENQHAKEEFLKRFDSEITKVKDDVKPEELYKTFLFGGLGRFTTDAIVLRKSVLKKTGFFYTEQKIKEDTSLWCRIAATSTIVSNNNPNAVGIRRVHDFNSIINSDNINTEQEKLLYDGLFRWALKQKEFSYDKKSDFFIGYKKMFQQESDFKVLTKFLKQNISLIFNKYSWHKIIQILK